MSKFKIRHITRYLYEETVRDSANQIILYPIQDDWQETIQHTIQISGAPNIDKHVDYFGNEIGTFTNAQPHRELTIDSQLLVVTHPRPMPAEDASPGIQWNQMKDLRFKPE